MGANAFLEGSLWLYCGKEKCKNLRHKTGLTNSSALSCVFYSLLSLKDHSWRGAGEQNPDVFSECLKSSDLGIPLVLAISADVMHGT